MHLHGAGQESWRAGNGAHSALCDVTTWSCVVCDSLSWDARSHQQTCFVAPRKHRTSFARKATCFVWWGFAFYDHWKHSQLCIPVNLSHVQRSSLVIDINNCTIKVYIFLKFWDSEKHFSVGCIIVTWVRCPSLALRKNIERRNFQVQITKSN